MRKSIKLLIIIYVLAHSHCINAHVHPLSKIIITSTKAQCKKQQETKDSYQLTYSDNVHVTLADETVITAAALAIDVSMNRSVINTKKTSFSADNLKKILFSSDVRVVQGGRSARADRVEIIAPSRRCIMDGNVFIKQEQKAPTDVPLTITCSHAEMDLDSGEIAFEGSASAPVATTLVLENHPALKKMKKQKKNHGKNTPTPTT
jgi:lipopolysaccharide assembly outer membrane protein LptD (OstA)